MVFKSLVGKMVEFFGRAADKLGYERTSRTRLLTRGLSFLHDKKMIREKKKESIEKKMRKEEEEEEGVWRRTIMMGEKCQPLEFSGVIYSGVIYYDGDGKQLATTSYSPLR